MKKQYLIIIFLNISLNSYCQQENKISAGFKIGMSFSNSDMQYVSNTSDKAVQMKTSFLMGGILNIAINKSLTLQPAMVFVSKGVIEKELNYNSRLNYHYIEFPVNLLYTKKTASGSYFLGGGLSPAFNSTNNGYYSKYRLKQFDPGINAMAAYNFSIGFSINLGYTYGLLNVSDEKTYINSIRNRYFSLAIGYTF